MFIIKITLTNLDVITALNGGVQPQQELNKHGGIELTYLVVEPGEVNRIINHDELMAIRKEKDLKKTVRQFYYAA